MGYEKEEIFLRQMKKNSMQKMKLAVTLSMIIVMMMIMQKRVGNVAEDREKLIFYKND